MPVKLDIFCPWLDIPKLQVNQHVTARFSLKYTTLENSTARQLLLELFYEMLTKSQHCRETSKRVLSREQGDQIFAQRAIVYFWQWFDITEVAQILWLLFP
jgi:hypothetical protein